ncbi:uncharacterized protein ARMOST_16180 [Armillaria ostoyae]|uniref:Integrase catalytic domain-containing protein n=1 Tax=Armillaria ostoyae TaxID=47428 RepID=A0A284RVH2_ARMOS|nr:uncharacterized protein ARMOST_16180 [Armillaria ostoyae]
MIILTIDETHKRIKSAMCTHQKWDQGIAHSLNHEKGIEEKDGLLYYDKRIYVPRDSATRGEVISCCHDHITAGHLGIEKTKELVLRDYWWPKLKRDVEAYIQGSPLHPNEVPSEPWTHISVDMITGLIPCKKLDAILVIVDHFSKAIILIACKTTLSSEGWAKILRDEVYAKYGMPVTVISDRGPRFVSKFLQDLYKMLDIKGNTSTAFHPQTDGQTECANQEIEKYLRIFINFRQTNWPEWLPLAAFQHNNRTHSATGKSPFFVNFGRNPRVVPDSHSHALLRTPASEAFKATMKLIHDKTKTALEKVAVQMKNQYDKKKKAVVEYQIGDKVWLNTTNLHLARPKKKLDDKRVSPFLILEKHGLSAYKLKLPPTWKIYPVFNKTLLTAYVAPTFLNQKQDPPPAPNIINDKEQYEIDTILDHKLRKTECKSPSISPLALSSPWSLPFSVSPASSPSSSYTERTSTRSGNSSTDSSNTLPVSQPRPISAKHLPPTSPTTSTQETPMASSSTPQTTGTQEPEAESPRHIMEAGPSRTVTSTSSQTPYPPRSPSAASHTSQTSYERTTLLAKARAKTRNLLRRRQLPAHPEVEPPPTIRAPLPQLPLNVMSDEAWASQFKE